MTLYTNRSVKIKFLEAMAERAHGFVKPQPEASRGNSSWNIPLPFLGFGSFRCSDERPPKPSSGERREALTKKTKNVRTVDGKAAFYQNLEPHVLQAFGVILVVICKVCFTIALAQAPTSWWGCFKLSTWGSVLSFLVLRHAAEA